MSGPLEGLRVAEWCGVLGQYAGKLLADMGADVVKFEPPGGSEARQVGPFVDDVPGPDRSLNFWYYNTNKRSVVADPSTEAGREVWRRLAGWAEVVIEDRGPGVLDGEGLGYRALDEGRRELIWCALTPFGQDGPWAGWQATDLVALALGGAMMMNGYDEDDAPGAPPVRGHGDQAYHMAGHYAVQGILAALLWRDRSGEGQFIDAAMHEAVSSTTEVALPYWFTKRVDVRRQTGRHAAASRTEPWLHRAADGRWVLVFGIGRDNASWRKVKAWFQAAGFGAQFDEPRFDDPLNRQVGRGSPEAAEISAELARFIAAHPAEEIYRGGQERRQAWGVVRGPEEPLFDPHWDDRGFWVEATGEGREKQPVKMPGAPYVFSATPWALRRPAPRLGEHTAEVLAELGLAET
ncbi:CoA transferase [Tepidiforma sp.]|uniref:CaiB/BaiF CoA transferase family protein n=1 Tax=Tepidiforma sp. TaxID=2682230 RepID=UPI002ADE691E|nr:CoA transferase [Tepidiforma sp.]